MRVIVMVLESCLRLVCRQLAWFMCQRKVPLHLLCTWSLANLYHFVYSAGARDPRAVKEPPPLISTTPAGRAVLSQNSYLHSIRVVRHRCILSQCVLVLKKGAFPLAETISSQTTVSSDCTFGMPFDESPLFLLCSATIKS